MKIVRLEVGSLEGEAKVDEKKAYLDKPVMLVYEGEFSSLDGPVTISSEDIDKLVSNHNSFLGKLSRLANGDIPLKHAPPLQLDHSTSARDTVGRLVGEIKVGEHLGEDGQPRKAIMGTARILGADNVERVLDGRWTNVSIGADLENHKITELSITPFPAAADASLLSRMGKSDILAKANQLEKAGYGHFDRAGKDLIFWARAEGKDKAEDMLGAMAKFDRISGQYMIKVKDVYDSKMSEADGEDAQLAKLGRKVVRRQVIKYAGTEAIIMIEIDGAKWLVSAQTDHGLIDLESAPTLDKAEEIFHRAVKERSKPSRLTEGEAHLAELKPGHKVEVEVIADGSRESVEGKVVVDDGQTVSVEYNHPIYGDKVTKLFPKNKVRKLAALAETYKNHKISVKHTVQGLYPQIDGKTLDYVCDSISEATKVAKDFIDGKVGEIDYMSAAQDEKLARLSAGVTIEKAKDTGKFFIRVGNEPLAGKDYGTPEEAKKAAIEYVKRIYGEEPSSIKVKLSEGGDEMPSYKEMKEKMATYDKCRKHLVEQEKMSDEDADMKLEAATVDDLTAMSAAADDFEKRMSEEAERKAADETARMSAMKEHKERLVQLAKGFKTTTGKINLAERKSKIMVRLAKLKAEQKISPAEIKALKLEELASKSDDVLDAALSSYDTRQPVIDVGLYGSTKALTASQLQTQLKKLGMEREELQTRLNMPSKRDGALKRLAELESEEKEINVHIDNVPGGSHEVEGYDLAWDEACKMMDEGKKDEAKEHLKSYMAKMSDKQVPAEPSLADPTEELTGLAEDMKKMQTSFEEFVKLAAPAFGATDEDLK